MRNQYQILSEKYTQVQLHEEDEYETYQGSRTFEDLAPEELEILKAIKTPEDIKQFEVLFTYPTNHDIGTIINGVMVKLLDVKLPGSSGPDHWVFPSWVFNGHLSDPNVLRQKTPGMFFFLKKNLDEY